LSETASPRGRVALVRQGLSGALDLSPNLIEQMYGCFACMACNEICPAGVAPADLALAMRSFQEELAPTRWKNMLFKELIPRPGRMELATWPLRLYERTGLRRLVYALGIRRLMPAQLCDLEAMLPRLPQRPLRQKLATVTKAEGQERYRVGFFLGCAQSLLFAGESAAGVRVLARNGCTVITPRQQVCCGMPATGYGRYDLVRQQASHNIALYEKAKVESIITDCATCGSTLKDYGHLLQDEPAWAERAAAFSAKVRDISEFLMQIPLEKPQGRIEARVTYHDPCHLRRGQGVWKQPRALLQMIDGLEYTELPEADWCCGSAGSQLITHYETSLKVMNRKLDAVQSTGATIVASGCPGCQMQLNVGVRRQGLDVKVVHPVELLERAYRQADKR
ncbi:MAG TPA: (Fe-S)-binding protein, partial [Anaerolineaceae bacterium]|nr:(Fe-S)-binding protein [Anaerolineaceae bacterium]